MHKSFLYGFLSAVILMAAVGVFRAGKLEAQGTGFAGVYPFWTSGGMLGFFNQNDGRIYLYDQNLKNLYTTARLESLGIPMQKD